MRQQVIGIYFLSQPSSLQPHLHSSVLYDLRSLTPERMQYLQNPTDGVWLGHDWYLAIALCVEPLPSRLNIVAL
jgi:hypothetical protein